MFSPYSLEQNTHACVIPNPKGPASHFSTSLHSPVQSIHANVSTQIHPCHILLLSSTCTRERSRHCRTTETLTIKNERHRYANPNAAYTRSSSLRLHPTHATNKHIQHPPDLPRILARLHRNLNALHKRENKIINFLAPAQLIGIKVEDNECDVGSKARDTVV